MEVEEKIERGEKKKGEKWKRIGKSYLRRVKKKKKKKQSQ